MSNVSELKETLTPDLLEEIREFWFEHMEDEDALILPGQSDMQRWFTRDETFDKICVAQFQPALDTIIESSASAADILDAIDISSPLDWLSIILLLDQVPRNCHRGDESKLVFGRFDPLAEEIAVRAIDAGIPTKYSEVRYRLARRFWFHMPLMHSENLAVHEQAVKQHEETAKDMGRFLLRDVSTLSEDEKKCYGILSNKQDALSALLTNLLDFEKRHKVIIERFGRYPHRNQALGRVPTAEETEYLKNGGETFG
ncbi:hypothetical protein PENSUB_7787 [Penicillium subrubescens]|uniref:DUF924 domain-containing protein n=2 Tax=Penicillium subrubescens TaxID=1316194 RepID=A0A1Q5TJD4_9EURO|nr:hypothetical protein PENSUB_7787 [Penicillium subrubescens]